MENVSLTEDFRDNPFDDSSVKNADVELAFEEADETTRFTISDENRTNDVGVSGKIRQQTSGRSRRSSDESRIAGAAAKIMSKIGGRSIIDRHSAPGTDTVRADKRADYLSTRERELEERETMLDERERQLSMQAEMSVSAANGGTVANNWPFKFYTIDRHNIEADIPIERQRLCKRAYHMWILTVLGLTWNCVTVATMMAVTTNVVVAPMEHVLWALIYLLLGVVGSWTGWYKGLYTALATSRSLPWLKFWVMFGLHVLYVAYSIVGLPNWATSGVFNLLVDLGPGGSWTVVIFCIVNIALWSLIGLLSVVIAKTATSAYRAGGGSNRLRDDVRTAVVQEIAVHATTASTSVMDDTVDR